MRRCVVCGISEENAELELLARDDVLIDICKIAKPCLARKTSLDRHPSRGNDATEETS